MCRWQFCIMFVALVLDESSSFWCRKLPIDFTRIMVFIVMLVEYLTDSHWSAEWAIFSRVDDYRFTFTSNAPPIYSLFVRFWRFTTHRCREKIKTFMRLQLIQEIFQPTRFFYKLLLRTCLSLSLTRCLLSVYFIIIQLEAFVVKWHYGKEEGTAIMNIVSGPLPTIEPRRYFGTRRHIATICRMFLTPFNVVLSQQCHRQLLLRRIIAW